MNQRQVLRFKLRLEVLSPVHIGCDDSLDPTNFVIDPNSNTLYFFDLKSLVDLLTDREHLKLREISEKKSPMALVELYRFYRSILPKLTKVATYSCKVPENLTQTYLRDLRITNERDIFNHFNRLTIPRTYYNPLNNCPVIPGSSLKGALRTGYMEGLFKHLQSSTQRAKDQSLNNLIIDILNINTETHRKRRFDLFIEFEKKILKFDDPSEDPFKHLIISDLTPATPFQTRVLYEVNLRKKDINRNNLLGRGISLPIEVIPAGIVFEGEMTLEKQIAPEIASINHRVLIDTNYNHYNRILKEERKLSNEHGVKHIALNERQVKALKEGNALILKLGKHSGAEAVTIDGLRKIEIRTTGGRKIMSDKATTWWVASELKRNPNGAIPFGWVFLEFIQT